MEGTETGLGVNVLGEWGGACVRASAGEDEVGQEEAG